MYHNKLLLTIKKLITPLSKGILGVTLFCTTLSTYANPVSIINPSFWDLPAGQNASNNVQDSYILSSSSNVTDSVNQYCNALGYTYISHNSDTWIFQRRMRWNNNQNQWVRTANQSWFISELICDDWLIFWCTDVNAVNYNFSANFDDWTCEYSNFTYPQWIDIWLSNSNNFWYNQSDEYLKNLALTNYCIQFGAPNVLSYDTIPGNAIPVNVYNTTGTGSTWSLLATDTTFSDIECSLNSVVVTSQDDRVLSFYQYIMILTWLFIIIMFASIGFNYYKKMYLYLARLFSMN